jgi:nicotinamidase
MAPAALVIVDVQYDFLPPNGSLAVPHAREILPLIEGLLDQQKWDWDLVIPTQVSPGPPTDNLLYLLGL